MKERKKQKRKLSRQQPLLHAAGEEAEEEEIAVIEETEEEVPISDSGFAFPGSLLAALAGMALAIFLLFIIGNSRYEVVLVLGEREIRDTEAPRFGFSKICEYVASTSDADFAELKGLTAVEIRNRSRKDGQKTVYGIRDYKIYGLLDYSEYASQREADILGDIFEFDNEEVYNVFI